MRFMQGIYRTLWQTDDFGWLDTIMHQDATWTTSQARHACHGPQGPPW